MKNMRINLATCSFRNASASKVVIPALFALAVSCAHGSLTLTTEISILGAAPAGLQPLDGDLLQTSVVSFTGENELARVRNGAFTGTPGENTEDFPAQTWGLTNDTTTYNFDLSVNTFGYDITDIRAYSAWNDTRASQSYRIFYATVEAPTTFTQLGADIVATGLNQSVITRTHDTTPGAAILSNVSSIRFVQFDGINPTDGVDTVFREFDVVGVASVPEPSTVFLSALGVLALIRRKR